jgi:hypothetical protein
MNIVIVIACLIGLAASQVQLAVAQNDVVAKGKQVLDSHKYAETVNPALDNTKPDVRLARSKRYNSISFTKLPQVQHDATIYNQQAWSLLKDREHMPVAESTTIAIGSIREDNSYFSENESAIYSEYSFAVTEVLRSVNSPKSVAGESLLCSREGGSIALPNGSKVSWLVPGQGYPKVGEQYLLFLRWNEEEQIFKILRVYLFSGEEVYSIDYAANLQQPYAGVLITSFVAQVKKKILAYEKNSP